MRDQIAHTKIGVLQKKNPNYPSTSNNPIRNVDYIIGSPDADERAANVVNDGTYDWIQVPQESSSPFSSTGYFKPNDNLIQLNTRKLNPAFDDIDLAGLETGKSSTDTGKALAENRHFKIRMRIRDVGTSGPGDIKGICEHIAINNTLYDNINSHPSWYSNVRSNQLAVAMVNIEQLSGSGCSEIGSQLDVLFTAAHPNLGNVNITMTGPGGPYGFTLPSTGSTEDRYGTATPNFTVSDLEPCAYIVNLSVEVLLTTGDAVSSNLHDEIAFCKS